MDRLATCAVLVLSFLVSPTSQQGRNSEKPTLVKIQLRSGSPIVGQLIDESNAELKLFDLRTGKSVTLDRKEILRMTKNISDKEVVSSVGLPAFVAWRIGGMLDSSSKSAKVVRVTDSAVYASFGAKTGTTKGQKLVVFRDQGEVKDPDTGKVLGKDLVEIARLEVTEVQADFCKTKVIGETKVEVSVGDVVQLDGSEGLLAILPLIDADGDETEGGRKLAEELTTVLVSRGVRSVERSLLEKALQELSVQQTDLFLQITVPQTSAFESSVRQGLRANPTPSVMFWVGGLPWVAVWHSYTEPSTAVIRSQIRHFLSHAFASTSFRDSKRWTTKTLRGLRRRCVESHSRGH